MTTDIEIAKGELSSEVTCVVVRDGVILHTASGIGVKPLLAIFDANKADLENASVADTVIGKAAAVILVLGKAKEVHGKVMSRSAADYLVRHGVNCSCLELVPLISNRTGDGMCPLEQSVSDIESPEAAIAALREQIKILMSAKSAQTK